MEVNVRDPVGAAQNPWADPYTPERWVGKATWAGAARDKRCVRTHTDAEVRRNESNMRAKNGTINSNYTYTGNGDPRADKDTSGEESCVYSDRRTEVVGETGCLLYQQV